MPGGPPLWCGGSPGHRTSTRRPPPMPRLKVLHASLLLLAVLALPGALAPLAVSAHDCLATDDLRLVYTDATLGWLAPYTARCYENSMAFHKKLWGYASSE